MPVPNPGWKAHRTIESSLARQSFREIVDEATSRGRRIVVTRHGRPMVAIVPMRDLHQLSLRDSTTDRRMTDSRELSPSATIPFDEFVEGVASGDDGTSGGEDRQSLHHIARDIAHEFAVAYLGPEVVEQAYEQAMGKLLERLDSDQTLNALEAEMAKAWVLECLWGPIVQQRKAALEAKKQLA